MEQLLIFSVGLVSGFCGVLVGAGGGFIASPILLILFKLSPEEVAGTSLALVAVNTAAAGFSYIKQGFADRRSALLFAASAIPGSILAPFAVKATDPNMFRIIFGVVLLGLSIYSVFKALRPGNGSKLKASSRIWTQPWVLLRGRKIITKHGETFTYKFSESIAVAFNFIIGFCASFFGVGAGFVRTPILVYAFSFPVKVAVATSVFATAFYTFVGAVTHGVLGHIDWYPVFTYGVIGFVLGGQIGVKVVSKVQGKWIIPVLMILLFSLGIKLIWDGINLY